MNQCMKSPKLWNTKIPKLTKNSHIFQTTTSYETQTIKQTTSPVLNGNGSYNGSPTFNSLPRSSTPHKPSPLYSNGSGAQTSGNLSELDSLLQDLSNARYGGAIEKKCEFGFCKILLKIHWNIFFKNFRCQSKFPKRNS